jgi:hypothetical protein
LELELIRNEAQKRYEQHESVHPDKWTWRPSINQLEDAWEKRGRLYGAKNHTTPSRSELCKHKDRVERRIYEESFIDLYNVENLGADDLKRLNEGEASFFGNLPEHLLTTSKQQKSTKKGKR